MGILISVRFRVTGNIHLIRTETQVLDETTIYKLADGNYMDHIERHFTYNGTDTWTDESGVEWNEVVK